MKFKLATPENEHIIAAFVNSHKNSKIYHTIAWKKIIQATYGYKPVYILLLDKDDLVGFLPLFLVRGMTGKKRLVGLPYSHMVHPLARDESVQEALLSKAEEIAEKYHAEYIQLKCEVKAKGNQWQHKRFYHDSVLDLQQDMGDILKNFKSSTRRNIKKAQKSGITMRTGDCPKDFNDFYELIVETR